MTDNLNDYMAEQIGRLTEYCEHVDRRRRGDMGYGSASAHWARGRWTVTGNVGWSSCTAASESLEAAVADVSAQVARKFMTDAELAELLGVPHAAE